MAAPTETTIEKTYSFDGATQAIQKLFSNDTADIHFTFQSNDEIDKRQKLEIGAHKALLSAMSPVFAASFSGVWKDEKNIEIRDSSFESFNAFLQYFYTNKVNINDENVGEILSLADYYQILDLMLSCSSFMENLVKKENVLDHLHLALKFRLDQLTLKCKKVISTGTLDVLKSAEFLLCSQDELIEILSIDTSSCVEREIFDACIKWAKAVCQRHNLGDDGVMDGSSMRMVLGSCFDAIRFEEMELVEVVDRFIAYPGFFSRNEIREAFISIRSPYPTTARYRKPSEKYTFAFERFEAPKALNPLLRFSLSQSVHLKAANLLKAIAVSYLRPSLGTCEPCFIRILQFNDENKLGSSDIYTLIRANMYDDNTGYGFRMPHPITLEAGVNYGIGLIHKLPSTDLCIVRQHIQTGLTLYPKYNADRHIGAMSHFSALHFESME